MIPTIPQLEQARADYLQMQYRAEAAGDEYHHVETLASAIRECDGMIRERRQANEVHAQIAYAREASRTREAA